MKGSYIEHMSDPKENKSALHRKFKASMKSSRTSCPFIKPARIMKEGRMIDAKCCTAYIPGFEVTEDREICEQCSVPEMGVREDRCRYFMPLSIEENAPTKWFCRCLGDKNIEAEQCSPERCSYFEPIERLKWEIGRPAGNAAKARENLKSERKKLVPKSDAVKSKYIVKKKIDSFSDGGYFYF